MKMHESLAIMTYILEKYGETLQSVRSPCVWVLDVDGCGRCKFVARLSCTSRSWL